MASYLRVLGFVVGILILIISCKSGGGGVSGPGDENDPPIKEPQEITSEFDGDSTGFYPGELRVILLANITLDEDEYSAQIDGGDEVSLYRNTSDNSNKSLVFIVPEVISGEHQLEFIIEEQSQVLGFEVTEYEAISNPLEFTENLIDSLDTELGVILNEVEQQSVVTELNLARDSLQQVLNTLPTMTEAEVAQLARVLKTNLEQLSNSQAQKMKSKIDQSKLDLSCVDPVSNIVEDLAKSAIAIYFISSSGAIASTGVGLVIGVAAGAIATVALINNLKSLKQNLQAFWDICITESVDPNSTDIILLDDSAEKSIPGNDWDFDFKHMEALEFVILTSYEAPDAIQVGLEELKDILDAVIRFVPQDWQDIIYQDYVVEFTEPAGLFNRIDIKTNGLEYELSAVSDTILAITFRYDEGTNIFQTRNFTFDLINDQRDFLINIRARLFPPAPTAENVSLEVEPGESVVGFFEAEYAASFSIVDSSSLGRVHYEPSFDGFGSFTYTAGNKEGTDSFTYTADNGTASSEVRTVSVNIEEVPDSLYGWYVGTYTLEPYEDSFGQQFYCGNKQGEIGKVAFLLMDSPNENANFIYQRSLHVFESLEPEIPTVYFQHTSSTGTRLDTLTGNVRTYHGTNNNGDYNTPKGQVDWSNQMEILFVRGERVIVRNWDYVTQGVDPDYTHGYLYGRTENEEEYCTEANGLNYWIRYHYSLNVEQFSFEAPDFVDMSVLNKLLNDPDNPMEYVYEQ
jgi:hypothetical protein